MPFYVYTAENKKGRKIKGEIEAVDEKIAMSQLKRRSLKVLKLKLKPKDLFANVTFMQPKVTKKDIVIFTRQFSTMIDAGLPLVQGLTILSDQTENKTFQIILKTIKKDVEGGSTLAEAMRKHPKVFDELFVNLIAAGEVGGILDTILQRLATFIEKAEELKSKIKGALTYPIVVVAIAIIVIGGAAGKGSRYTVGVIVSPAGRCGYRSGCRVGGVESDSSYSHCYCAGGTAELVGVNKGNI